LAQPPDISDTFVREVDENLRRDQVEDFFKRYGSWIVAAVVLFLLVSGGLIWWKQHQLKENEARVEKLAQTYTDIASGNVSRAPQQFDELSKQGSKAVRATAMFARAAVALQQGDPKQAAGVYQSIAGDTGFPKPYRDAALIRQTALQFDQLQPQEVISRLQPLAKPGEPWFGSAGEMTALALIKQNKKQEAGQLFLAIAKDNGVPRTIRARAVQIAGSLGVDASSALPPQAQ
jgi:hypothetical protein